MPRAWMGAFWYLRFRKRTSRTENNHKMRRKIGVGFWTFLLLLSFIGYERLFAQNSEADVVLIHGHILTVDAKDSVVEALAIQHGVIVKVGSDREVLEFAG